MRRLTAKPVSESVAEMVEIVLPNDANPLGNILGGKVMHLMDIAGAIAAIRHARRHVVTVAVDSLDFLHPIRVGQHILLRAHVTCAFRTSMEVEVRVFLEDPLTGARRQTSSAYLTYVALDPEGRPARVPPLLVQTAEERQRHREALARRRRRLALARSHRKSIEAGK
jgi:acyl-CoA hydrolase